MTSYAELVLAPHADDVAHPAFMKLFVATEYLKHAQGTCRQRGGGDRRPSRRPGQRTWPAWKERVGASPRWKTDRARFPGRGYSGIRSPTAL